MKTLDEVEPRKPISSVPITISEPGSYYLSGNLRLTEVPNITSIMITVSGVTLDLMSFTLSSVAAVNGDAIRVNAGLRDVTIKNGVSAGVSTVTGVAPDQTWIETAAGFLAGIAAAESNSCHFANLRISGCRTVGVKAGSETLMDAAFAQPR